MATEWMAYWRSKQFREAYENASLETIGSRQFKEVGVGPGDRIWIVSAPGRRKLRPHRDGPPR